ncbi:UNVERIFIED_CONTAM: hypothetical protein HDU68_003258 [Siphonaria sp. JEL0065]|nr:hypothetical protein HDU68_003258 [Siphonaria sp. JEL0065]
MPAPIRNTQFSLNDYGRGNVSVQPDEVFHKAQDFANSGAVAVKQVLDKYPPFKAFVYSFLATSALPITVFTAITGSTFLGSIAVAGTGIAVFQGLVLAITGFIVFWFLLAAFLFSGGIGVFVLVAYFGVQAAKAVAQRANERKV